MLKILKCYRLDRTDRHTVYYDELVVFKSKISVGKLTGKNRPYKFLPCFRKQQ